MKWPRGFAEDNEVSLSDPELRWQKDKMLVLISPEDLLWSASYPWEDRTLHLVTSETMRRWKWGKCKFWINLTSPILSPNESPHSQSEMFPTNTDWEWILSKKDYSPDWFRTNFSSPVCATYSWCCGYKWLTKNGINRIQFAKKLEELGSLWWAVSGWVVATKNWDKADIAMLVLCNAGRGEAGVVVSQLSTIIEHHDCHEC